MAIAGPGARFPYLHVTLRVRDRVYQAEALLDTGFDGDAIIPVTRTADLGGADNYQRWRLADGSRLLAPVYLGNLSVSGQPGFSARVAAVGDEYLIGLGAIRGFKVTLDHGRTVTVEP